MRFAPARVLELRLTLHIEESSFTLFLPAYSGAHCYIIDNLSNL